MKQVSIQLPDEQQAIVTDVLKHCNLIEGKMLVAINSENTIEIETQLADLILSLGDIPRLMAQATAIYDTAKGMASQEAMSTPEILNAKQNIQRMYFDGRLSKYNAIYIRVENIAKDIRNQIEGLRSLLSFQKEEIRNRVFEQSRNL